MIFGAMNFSPRNSNIIMFLHFCLTSCWINTVFANTSSRISSESSNIPFSPSTAQKALDQGQPLKPFEQSFTAEPDLHHNTHRPGTSASATRPRQPRRKESGRYNDSGKAPPSPLSSLHHLYEINQFQRTHQRSHTDYNLTFAMVTDTIPGTKFPKEIHHLRKNCSTPLVPSASNQERGQNGLRETGSIQYNSSSIQNENENENRTLQQKVPKKAKPSDDNYKVDLIEDQTEKFPIAMEECSRDRTIVVRGYSGIIYFTKKTHEHVIYCKWKIIVKEGHFLAARFESTFRVDRHIHAAKIDVFDGHSGMIISNYYHHSNFLIYSSSNMARFEGWLGPGNFTKVYLFFTTLTNDGKTKLQIFKTSLTVGYVISPGFGGKARYSRYLNAWTDLVIFPDNVVMISFPHVEFSEDEFGACITKKLIIYAVHNQARHVVACIWGPKNIQPRVYNSSLTLALVVSNDYDKSRGSGFRMDFSFHHISEAPVIFNTGLLNCSRSTYNAFKQHVHCNLARDCASGEDEGGHCPFSSPLCNGSVASGTKCYESFGNETRVSWEEADQACKSHGGVLAVLRTEQDKEALKRFFDVGRWWSAGYVGLKTTFNRLPYMYRNMWLWSDDVVAYSANPFREVTREEGTRNWCVYAAPYFPRSLTEIDCSVRKYQRYFCEFDAEGVRNEPERYPNRAALQDLKYKMNALWSDYTMTQCLPGHVTFSFLSCEPFNDCGAQKHRAYCTTLYPDLPGIAQQGTHDGRAVTAEYSMLGQTSSGPVPFDGTPSLENVSTKRKIPLTVLMFACFDSRSAVPYSLVCDYVRHCRDGSDETFCNHGDKCSELTCDNGQCFSSMEKCNKAFNCRDRSDEENCQFESSQPDRIAVRLPPPTIVDFDGHGDFTQRRIQESDSCPETHFRCTGIKFNCLPVYVRCNGVYDCPGRKDEEACDLYRCPGFYRCRESKVCVHADHMCDGWPQCPQSDDEVYCGLTCPPSCQCQGMAFVCSVTFPARNYPEMRYLDASHSKTNPVDLLHNFYLVWLRMASCSIQLIPVLTWPNVMYLDLSQNELNVVNMDSFLNLANLKTLILADNPLMSFVGGSVCSAITVLKNLDISKTMLREFDSDVLTCYSQMTKLNISHCPLNKITHEGFKATPYLTNLDLSGSPVSDFPRDIFKGLNRLLVIFAENYKLCCKATLPNTFNEMFCFAPQDDISSCDDLLKSNLFRGCIWISAALAVVGNCGCFFVKLFSEGKRPHSGFNVFVINLSVADFFMGVYLVIVGVADEVYRGQYLWYEGIWKTSKACTAAGFLSFLSSEMSAFFISLITLDRFIVLTFPFSNIRFRGLSATVTCALVWATGGLLASVPLFPRTPKWDFYGHTGICIPLPITTGGFPGYQYAFGVVIILNFILFVLIAVGQASIYWSVRTNTMVSDTSRKSKDLVIARRLLSVAASDFLCWFPIGFFGLISSKGVFISSEIRVAMTIFVLPLNSALNPFLYTFNVVMERRRKAHETQLMRMLEKRIRS